MTDEHDPATETWEPDWDPPKKRGVSVANNSLSSRSAAPRGRRDRKRKPLPGPIGAGLALVPTLFAYATLLGIGLRNDLPPWEAGLGAGLLIVLPILGIASIGRYGPFSILAAMWLWSLAVLVGLPSWIPGERAAGLAEGLAFIVMPLGEGASTRAGQVGRTFGDLLGPDPSGPPATAVVQPTPHDPDAPETRARTEEGGKIVLPYEGDAGSLRVQVTFDGPDFSEELDVLFDTGATFTTLDRGVLSALGVTVPPDAPMANFQTANGKVSSPMVLLERVWLGDTAVEGVTVAVCDDCSQEGTAGLLGLNVTQQFRMSVDHETREVVLEDASGPADRHLDLTHWIALEGRATRWPTGRVVIDMTATNKSPRQVHEAVIEVECPERSFAVTVTDLSPGASEETSFELPRGATCDSYSLVLRSGRW